MSSLNVLTFDAEGRAVDFEVWLDDLQLFLQCDSKDGLSLFDLTSGASTAPATDADSTVRSQWLTRDAAARLAVRNHLPSTERAHFSKYKSARALYDALVARYSSPTTAALSRLMLPYPFPDLVAFATVADLVAHLRTSDARYPAALPTEFLPTNSPPMYITLYYLVTRLPDSLSSVRDHFLSLCPTELTIDLLDERLAAAEKSILAEVGAASAPSWRCRTGKGKGSRGGGGGGGGSGGGGGGGGRGGSGSGGVGGGSGGRGSGGGGGGGGGSGGGGSGGGGAGRSAATQRGGLGGSQRLQQLRTRETPSVQQLREWYGGRGRSGVAGPCMYVLRTGTRSGEVCGLPHTTQRCFGRLTDAWRTQFPNAVELPRWHDLLLQNVRIFDLDFDAILDVMYALADITEGDCYLRVPPDPRTVAAALGASASAAQGACVATALGASASAAPGACAATTLSASASAAPGAGTSPLSGTTPTASFHTFTLDSGASRSFFRDSTTLTPLNGSVAVSLADPSGGPELAHSSTVLSYLAAPSGLLSGLHLPSFYTNLVSGTDLQDAWFAALGASEAAAPGACTSTAPGAGEAAPLGAGESALSGAAVLHSFTLDSGASRSFFKDTTTLTPLSRPVAVSLADPSGGPVLAHSSTVLPCPAASSGLLSGLHLPSFSTNLVSGADLQDTWVDQFTPGGQCVTHCTCSRMGHHLATFTRRPGSSLYTLTTVPPPVPTSGQVAASSQVFAAASRSSPASAPFSCRPLAHESLLWHHRLGHPSLPRLQGMASRALDSGLPRSLPPLPPRPAPICVPCVEGRQRAAPHSSSFPPTEAPLHTLHMDVWDPARVRGQGHERYFLLVVDDYSRYTTVFPLRSKGEVPEVLIDWIRGARCQLSESFGSNLPVLRLHSDRGGEFSSDLLRAFCRSEGIRQVFTLPASPQQNGIAEHRIGMVMDVARMSMIHVAAPHFLWPFAVQYAAHQINLQPWVSLPETTPTLRWTGKVGDASAFRVYGSQAFVRDTTADKLSSRAVPCVFLGFPPDAPSWQFYQPTSRRVLSSQDVTFDELVSYYCLFPYRTAFPPPPPTALPGTRYSPGRPPPPPRSCPSSVSQVDPVEPVEVAVDSSAARGAEPRVSESGGAETRGAESGGAETELGGVEPAGTVSGGALGVPSRREPLCPQWLREWYSRRCPFAVGSNAAGAGAAGGAGGATGATGGAGTAGGGAGARAAGGGAGAGTAGASGVSGGATRPRPYYVPLLQKVHGSPPSTGPPPPFVSPPPVQSQSQLLPGRSPYSCPTRGRTERREPESRPVSPESRSVSPVCPVRAGCVSCPRLPPVRGSHSMTLRPSTAPRRVPLPSPHASSLPNGPDPESDSLRAASPTVNHFLATAVTDPLFESSSASALVAELADFAAA
ncbi:unnamed protein product [Closterium sp. NIES-53]